MDRLVQIKVGVCSYLRLLAITVSATALVLLLLEIYLRVFPIPIKVRESSVLHPDLGHTGPAGETLRGATVVFDKWGFRDFSSQPYSSHNSDKRSQRTIYLLGDSVTEAITVSADKAFMGLLGKLPPFKGEDFLIQPVAAGDWGPIQSALALMNNFKPKSGDIILLQFLGFNDFLDFGFEFYNRHPSIMDEFRPYYREHGGSSIPLGDSVFYHSPLKRRLMKVSHLYWLWLGIAKGRENLNRLEVLKRTQETDLSFPPCHLEKYRSYVEQFSLDSDQRKKFLTIRNRYSAFLHQWRSLVPEDIPILIVYFPSRAEIDLSTWKEKIEGYRDACIPMHSLDRNALQNLFSGIIAPKGVYPFSLSSLNVQGDFLDLEGHLTPSGHAKVALELRQILLPFLRIRN